MPKAALMSNDLFLDDAIVLLPIWLWGAVATAQPSPIGPREQGFLRLLYLVTVEKVPLQFASWAAS